MPSELASVTWRADSAASAAATARELSNGKPNRAADWMALPRKSRLFMTVPTLVFLERAVCRASPVNRLPTGR